MVLISLILIPGKARLKTSLSTYWEKTHELAGNTSHLPVRNEPDLAHPITKYRRTGHIDSPVLHRIRRRDRRTNRRSRRRQLRRIHRTRSYHAVGIDAQRFKRIVWHLFPKVHRNDLRSPVGTAFLF